MYYILSLIWNVIYFPLWWYGQGTYTIGTMIVAQAKDLTHTLNLKVLAKFLFVPMYGLTDIWSRLISFPVRLVHLSLLSTAALLYILGLLVVLVLWVSLPVFVIYNIVYQLSVLWT